MRFLTALLAVLVSMVGSTVLAHDGPELVAVSAVQIDKLDKLATHLETNVDQSRFNMALWGNQDDASSSEFTGCAAGYATSLFSQQGFKLHRDVVVGTTVQYQGKEGHKACAEFFGLPEPTAIALFSPGLVNTPKAVAGRIRDVIDKERKEVATREARKSLFLIALRL